MSVRIFKREGIKPAGDVTVVIFERTKFARVDWDYFRLPEENDSFFKEHEAEITKEVQQIYLRVERKGSECQGTGIVGHFDNVLKEDARVAADRISAVFDDFVRRRVASLT